MTIHFQDWRSAALFRYKILANITVVMCDHVVFRVDARAFRNSVNIGSIKKGKVYNYSCRLILV